MKAMAGNPNNNNNNNSNNSLTLTKQTLTTALDQWKVFNLPLRKATLDNSNLSAKSNSQKSLAARRILADKTKRFKKALKDNDNTDNIGKEGKDTIKGYQEEIDALTKRCKAAEGANLVLSQSLSDLAPMDPYEMMKLALEHIYELEEQNNPISDGYDQQERKCLDLERQIEELKSKLHNDANEITQLHQDLAPHF